MLRTEAGSGDPEAQQEDPIIVSSRELAKLCARIAEDKKADDLVVLDIRKLSFITDYFVIASGHTAKQLQATALELETRVKTLKHARYGKEGYEVGTWILLDFGDVVVHLFHKDLRKHYDLESNWADARRVDWRSDAPDEEDSPEVTEPKTATG